MESTQPAVSTKLKHSRPSSDNILRKCFKYNSFLPLIRGSAFCKESKDVFDTLIKLNVDVDYYDSEDSNCTPLCYAVQNQLLEWTKLLLENGANPALAVNDDSEATVSDIAWDLNNYDILVEIIYADGPYPRNFKKSKLNTTQLLKINAFQNIIDQFHEQIKNNLNDEVQTFTKKFSNLKHAYNIENISALTTALKHKNYKTYSFLRSMGFGCGIDNMHDFLLKNLKKRERKLLDTEIEKYFEYADFHILDLLSMSRLGMNNDRRNFKKLKDYYEKLDEIEEIQPILKILSSQKTLSLIFDFNRSSIENLDPGGCLSNSKYKVRGRAYEKKQKILIAADQRSESDLLGILAQEFMHFALLKVYNNEFLPYHSTDFENQKNFADIVGLCKLHKNEEKIIADAFEYEKEKQVALELIARVPQLIVQNNSSQLLKNQKTFKELFEYFNGTVMLDLKREVLLIEPKQNLQELNRTLGILQRLKKSKMCHREPKSGLSKFFDEPGNIFLRSKMPDFALLNIVEAFKLNDCENIYVELEQLTIINELNAINEICETFELKIFVLDSVSVEEQCVAAVFDKIVLEGSKLIFISNRFSDNVFPSFRSLKEINFRFTDLTQESKKEILYSDIDFQGFKVKLNDIFGDDIEQIEFWPLEIFENISKVKLIDFERFFPKTSDVLVPRSFKASENSEILDSLDVVKKLITEKTIIVADVAGMGKTTSAVDFTQKINLSNQLSCVVFFDLKQYTKIFEDQKLNRNLNLDQVLKEMLSFEKEIDMKLFKYLFKNSKSIFVIDGFDEISPSYKDLVFKIMYHVQIFGNCLMVTARTHLETELVERLGSKQMPLFALKLLPFSEENQFEFLTKFWRNRSDHHSEADLEKKARKLIKKCNTSLVQKQIFLEIPLQLFMLADLNSTNSGGLNYDFKLFSLYEYFVKNKLKIHDEKGKLASDDNANIKMEGFDFLQFHQKKAIETIYGPKVANSLQFAEVPKFMDKDVICRNGFLQLGFNGSYQFSHQTFGDFFVAQLLLKSVTTKTYANHFMIVHKLFATVLVGNGVYDKIIRNFLNEKLKIYFEVFHQKEMSKILEENLISESNYGFLIRFVEKKQFNLINFVFKKLNLSKETKMKIIGYKNSLNYNALHIATACSDSWRILWNCIERFTNKDERKDVLLTRGGVDNCSIYRMYQNLKTENFPFVVEIHRKLWINDTHILKSLCYEAEKTLPLEKPSSSLEMLWNSITDYLEPEHQKELLFEKPYGELFRILITSSVSVEIVLNTARNLFNKEELNDFILKTDWFCNDEVQYTLSSESHKKILNFFQKCYTGNNKDFLNIFKDGKILPEESVEPADSREYFMISEILDALNKFILSKKSKENNLTSISKFTALTLVQISGNQEIGLISLFWIFIEKTFCDQEHKKLLLLKYNSVNTLLAVTKKKTKSILDFIYKKLNNLFQETFLNITDYEWLTETLCEFAANSESEAFDMFWSFFQKKLDEEARKSAFYKAIMYSSQNENTTTIKRIIEIAKGLVGPEEFVKAARSNDQIWLVESLCRYAFFADFQACELFWSLLAVNLEKHNQKLVFLQRNQTGGNSFMISSENKDNSTTDFFIKKARELIEPNDFATALKSHDQNWVVDTLCRYAAFSQAENFASLWSFLKDNLNKVEQKVVFLQKNEKRNSVLMISTENRDKNTAKLIIKIAKELLGPEDFIGALKSSKENWVVDTLCRNAAFAEPEIFKTFWSFLLENLEEDNQKSVFLKNNNNGISAFMISSENRDSSTTKLIIHTLQGLLDCDDFSKALKFGDGNWIVNTLCRFSTFAEYETFTVFWSLVQDNLVKNDQKKLFLQKNTKGNNVLMCSCENKDTSTIKLIIDTASNLLDFNDFDEALKSKDQNWLAETLCRFASLADSEAFIMFWSFIEDKIDKNDQKKILLWKNRKGCNAFMIFSENKDKFLIEFVIDKASCLFDRQDFVQALEYPDQNWMVDVLCRFATFAKAEALGMFWSFLEENLDRADQRLVLLEKNSDGENTFMRSSENKDISSIELIIDTARDLIDSKDYVEALKSGDQNWLAETLCRFASLVDSEAFLMFWSFLQENLDTNHQKLSFLQKNRNEKNVILSSHENKNESTRKLVIETARGLLDSDDIVTFLEPHDEN